MNNFIITPSASVLLGMLLISCFSCLSQEVIDIDGNTYKTTKIGNQLWMAENLKVSKYSNGDIIANVKDSKDWEKLISDKQCDYNNDSSTHTLYGKLYNWLAVNDSRGLCPKGWHIPSDSEWQQLVSYLGGNKIAGGKMKSKTLWNKPNEGATNSCGFNALPAGLRFFKGSSIYSGRYSGFWTSTEGNVDFAWLYYLDSGNEKVTRQFYGKMNGFSCRCIKD